MKSSYLWIAVGLAACGDNHGLAPDAHHGGSPDSPAPTDDGPPIDSPIAPADAPPTPGLRIAYSFEDTGTVVSDDSGRGFAGTLSDPAAWTAAGRVGRGLALSGDAPATQFVSLPDGVLDGVDDFTISVWVKLNAVHAWSRIYDIGNGLADPANRFMYLTVNGWTGPTNDGIHASSYGGAAANESITASGTQLPAGVWKHLTLTGHGGDRTLYVDGYPVAHVTGGPVVPPSSTEPIAPSSWLGKSRFPDPGLDGTLDDFRIYDHVLADTEIAQLAWPQLDYMYWRFDETTGSTAKDSSDHGVPTVLANGAAWAAGKRGGAVDLPGGAAGATGPMVSLGANPLAGCTDQLTVAAWVKLRALTPWSRIFDFGTGNTAFIYLAPTDGAGMHFAMVAPTGLFDMVTAGPPIAADAAWHHVAVTVDAASLVTLYADGAPVMTQTSATVRPGDFAGVTENYLGKSRFPDPYLNGAIDELRIACRAYTADEIRDLSR